MVVQGDSIPGSTLFAVNMPVGVTAHYYHVSAGFMDIPVELTEFTTVAIKQYYKVGMDNSYRN